MKQLIALTLFLSIAGCATNQTQVHQASQCDLLETVAGYRLSVTDLVSLKKKINQQYTYPDGSRPQQALNDGEICGLIKARTVKLFDSSEIKRKQADPEKDVVTEQLDNGLFYISIKRFVDNTAIELERILADQAFQYADGVVIDLRGNLGGTLYSVNKVAQLLGPTNRLIGETKGSMPGRYYTDKRASPIGLRKPMVVLVDDKTSSGAELLAAFIKNHHLGTVAGKKTAGAGVVRTVVRVNSATIMLVPVNYLFDSNGQAIEGHGVEPDITLSQDDCKEINRYGLCKATLENILSLR